MTPPNIYFIIFVILKKKLIYFSFKTVHNISEFTNKPNMFLNSCQVNFLNGSFTQNARRNTRIAQSLSLSFIHVPKHSTNLLSINSITKNLNCSIAFYVLSHSVFQDLATGQKLEGGYGSGVLNLSNPKVKALSSASLIWNKVGKSNMEQGYVFN